jgi:hypothetical protein
MNYLAQFQAVFNQELKSVAKITQIINDNQYWGETNHIAVKLYGKGYAVGQTVFYNAKTGEILETAPDLDMVELVV